MAVSDITDNKPNEEAVKYVEGLLAQLKSGEVRSVICVVGYNDNYSSHGWALDSRTGRRELLAGLVMAQHDFVVSIGLQEGSSVLSKNID